jgi:hypothetical protein
LMALTYITTDAILILDRYESIELHPENI